MRVVEVFYSLQGEGMLAGTPSVFVRLAGCPVRCERCDTGYAWDFSAGEELSPDQIVRRVDEWPCGFVVVTGGEPMVGPDSGPRAGLPELTHCLARQGKHVTIETAGILFVPDLACDLMSISPKLAGWPPPAGRWGRVDIQVIRQLMQAYSWQLKFVIESPQEMPAIHAAIEALGPIPPERVMLMPQAATVEELRARASLVAELCKQTGFRFGQRLHICLWSGRRGT